MTSKDDDTLPLPGFSQELSNNTTVDEDIIPTSQPQSTGSLKMSRSSDTSFTKCTEDLRHSQFDSVIDDTLPAEAVIDQSIPDKSADFIPDTETKKTEVIYSSQDFTCKKKLLVFGDDIFRAQSNSLWEKDVSRISESPSMDTQKFSVFNEFSKKIPSSTQDIDKKCDESIAEIDISDSAETVVFGAPPIEIKKTESEGPVEKLEVFYNSNSDSRRPYETQMCDSSSVLLLDQSRFSSLETETHKRIKVLTSEKSYLQETLDDNEENLQKNMDDFNLKCSSPAVVDILSKKSAIAEETLETPEINMNSSPKEELPMSSSFTEQNNASIVTRKVEVKLSVSCFVTLDTKTNKILQKIISKVNEIVKSKPKSVYKENVSDNASDKSKRFSTSSSGSVYSDKTGLPFVLPKRVSAFSDQIDSSEEEFSVRCREERRILERVPWKNEHLLPLKMDDIMQISIENEELLKRPNIESSLRKSKSRRRNEISYLTEKLESSSFEQTSCNLGTEELQPNKTSSSEEMPGKSPLESYETAHVEATKKLEKASLERIVQEKVDSGQFNEDKQEEQAESEPVVQKVNVESEAPVLETKRIEEQIGMDKESLPVELCDGLPVFARWTDKRYYSGILSGSAKNDRWDVKFDDGTLKTVREDFIMPAEWLKVGALVFALTDDKYESGQIINVKLGSHLGKPSRRISTKIISYSREEFNYIVELDVRKKKVCVKISDLCLTDIMADIIREKYKPLSETPRGKADIDFDNVLSGKRLREHKTPLRLPAAIKTNSSGGKKKSSSKAKENNKNNLETGKKNSQMVGTGGKIRGLKSESGHLVEDKVISADSPSANEMEETPLRRRTKEPRGKAKPRSLSYEVEETRPKRKSKNWLAQECTPIPGPSGVRFRKQKVKARAEESEKQVTVLSRPALVVTRSSKKSPRSYVQQSAEKSKRKRKSDEPTQSSIHKKSFKEGDRLKTRTKKG